MLLQMARRRCASVQALMLLSMQRNTEPSSKLNVEARAARLKVASIVTDRLILVIVSIMMSCGAQGDTASLPHRVMQICSSTRFVASHCNCKLCCINNLFFAVINFEWQNLYLWSLFCGSTNLELFEMLAHRRLQLLFQNNRFQISETQQWHLCYTFVQADCLNELQQNTSGHMSIC